MAVCVCHVIGLAVELQANITTQQRSEELLELQETLSWPNLASLCPDSYIPEVREVCLWWLNLSTVCTGPVSRPAAVQGAIGYTHTTTSPQWSSTTHRQSWSSGE